MQPLFRVFLNGQFIMHEPIGLTDTELTIARDEDLKGVFFSFTSDLTFWGDGYDVLKIIKDTATGCSQVPCNIEYQCSETRGYEVLFEGVIPLGIEDIEWDEYNCTVTVKLENADFSNFLQTYGDYEIPINRPFCLDGTTALTPITENATEFFPSFDGVLSGVETPTYLFTDVFQQALGYLSNGSVNLNADALYSTLYKPQILKLTFVDAIAAGDTATISWTNYFGQQYSTTHAVGGPGLTQDNIDILLAQLLNMGPSFIPLATNRNNYFEKASWVEIAVPAPEIWNHLEWQSYSVTYQDSLGTPKNATLVETQAAQYGLKNLALTSSTRLQGQESTVNVTLNKLLTHASEFHNMGFQLVKNVLTYDFNLTPLSDLINNTDTTINLPKLKSLKSKTSGTYNVATLTTPKGKADNVFKPLSFDVRAECYGDQKKMDGDNYSSQEIFDYFTNSQVQDDELVFVFLKEADLTEVERYKFRLSKESQITLLPITSITYNHYNIPYIYGLLPLQYFIMCSDNNLTAQIPLSSFDTYATCSNCPDAVIVNPNTKKLPYQYKFEYNLSFTQVRTLIENSTNYITFSDARNTTKQGFIKEVKIPFKNFICDFTVYSE